MTKILRKYFGRKGILVFEVRGDIMKTGSGPNLTGSSVFLTYLSLKLS